MADLKKVALKLPSGKDFLNVAAEITQAFFIQGIEATLVGGSVCAIYTNNENQSSDIDFVSTASYEKIGSALASIGFQKDVSRNFIRRNALKGDIRDMIFMDFVGRHTQIGEANVPEKELARLEHNGSQISILTPTQTVMDRLSKYFYHTDTDALNHAVTVTKKYPVDLEKVKRWCEAEKGENTAKKYEFFLARLTMSHDAPDTYSKAIIEKLKSSESTHDL